MGKEIRVSYKANFLILVAQHHIGRQISQLY